MQIIVQAVNNNLQGLASDPIQFTVLLPVSRLTESSPTTPIVAPAVKANGNGSNGHANSGRVPARVS